MTFRFSERMSKVRSSFIRESLKLTKRPGMISLAGGMPAPELFPVEQFRQACDMVLKEQGRSCLQYDTTEGYLPLREHIASVQMKKSGVMDVAAVDITITNGSQQGLDLVGRLFIDKGDVIICESPTYIGAINAFNANMPRFVQVPMDEDGMIISELENALRANPTAKFIYTIPDFQNPTGRTLSLERRKSMLELAESYNIPIIEDSPYASLRYEGEHIPAIKSMDEKGLVVYLGSFSKIFAPGLRVGWICAQADILSRLIILKQGADLQTSSIAQRELVKLIEIYDMDEHVARINALYSRRRNLMLETISREFPAYVKFSRPQGGFFIWVTLPEGTDTMELHNRAVEENVTFVPGATFYADNDVTNSMRLNFASMDEEKIVEGIQRLAEILRR
jgi:DNA-binding transcriptional MocR family regulator